MTTHIKNIMTKEEALNHLEGVFLIYSDCFAKSHTGLLCNKKTIGSDRIDRAFNLKEREVLVSIVQYQNLRERYSESKMFHNHFRYRFDRGFLVLMEERRSSIVDSIISQTPLSDPKDLLSRSLFRDEREREVFLASFLALCYTQEMNYNQREQEFFINLLIYCIENLDVCSESPFVSKEIKSSVKNYLNIHSSTISLHNKECLESFISSLEEKAVAHILSKKDYYLARWATVNDNDELQRITILSNYCLTKKNVLDESELTSLYELLERWSNRSYYYQRNLLEAKSTLLALINPQALVSKAKSSMKGQDKEKRSAVFMGVIKAGLLDSKIARKIRSESSSEVSNRCLIEIFDRRVHYKNSVDLVSQFLDSKYQDVADTILIRGNIDDLMGLVGNPLVRKNRLFDRIELLKRIK